MTMLLAAVGATVSALLELTVGSYVRIGSAQPHLVLVLGIVVAVAIGLEASLTWALVGGLTLDILAQRPLGSTAFALVIGLGVAWVIGRVLTPIRPVVPIVATAILSVPYSMAVFIAFNALRSQIAVEDPLSALLPGAIYDIALAIVIGPLLVSIHDRRMDPDRVDRLDR